MIMTMNGQIYKDEKNFYIKVSNYSNLPLKHVPVSISIPVKSAIFFTKIRVHILLFENVTQNHLPQMHEVFTLDIQS